MAESVGCARPTGARVGEPPAQAKQDPPARQENPMVLARVGQKAPDFQAPAYHKGKFGSVKLSDFAGKWLLLCFYPGDFTYV